MHWLTAMSSRPSRVTLRSRVRERGLAGLDRPHPGSITRNLPSTSEVTCTQNNMANLAEELVNRRCSPTDGICKLNLFRTWACTGVSATSNSVPERHQWLIWTVWSYNIYGECVGSKI